MPTFRWNFLWKPSKTFKICFSVSCLLAISLSILVFYSARASTPVTCVVNDLNFTKYTLNSCSNYSQNVQLRMHVDCGEGYTNNAVYSLEKLPIECCDITGRYCVLDSSFLDKTFSITLNDIIGRTEADFMYRIHEKYEFYEIANNIFFKPREDMTFRIGGAFLLVFLLILGLVVFPAYFSYLSAKRKFLAQQLLLESRNQHTDV